MTRKNFYAELPTLHKFLEITESQKFWSVPDDWYIIITDIVGSTKAIENGRYKDINLIGSCSIIAILNIAQSWEIPFVFGGDGASILIPPHLLSESKQALLATQYFAKQEFNLDLRVGIVPVSAVNQSNYQVEVAKLKISETYHQGIFTGGGLTYATQLIKDPITAEIYNLQSQNILEAANFSGLRCPWQEILSPHEEVVSLLVMSTVSDWQEEKEVYKIVLEEIYEIYGAIENVHPVVPQNIKLCFKNESIYKMAKIKEPNSSIFKKMLMFIKLKLKTFYTALLLLLKINTLAEESHKLELVENTDYKKFDDMLRMIISGDRQQRERLVKFLEKQYQKGKLVYGTHVSDRLLMTCVVPVNSGGRHVHFVDGADGGYALAAKDMKARINRM
ncbi:DUF3095 domain-containing protein [Aerosakkonemataceae cyanobacterium BLCC-F50]|uniref:DUF3095 domain-containing protein n=1 Tax=Floridaenema flaviceps BLCC-F50 TaxID=3153642 RepID=A0ABV4XQK7_9CYAN